MYKNISFVVSLTQVSRTSDLHHLLLNYIHENYGTELVVFNRSTDCS